MGCLLCFLLGAGAWQTGTHWPGRRSINLGMGCLLRLLPGWLGAWLSIQLVSARELDQELATALVVDPHPDVAHPLHWSVLSHCGQIPISLTKELEAQDLAPALPAH